MPMSKEGRENIRRAMKARWEKKKQETNGGTAVLEKPPFIVFNRPDIGQEEIDAVEGVLKSGWLSSGNYVKEFESEFAEFMGEGYAVSTSSCTDALLIACKVLGLGTGIEVITTPLTFAATLNAILLAGAMPKLVDVDMYGLLDPEKIRFAITNKTRAIVPIHLYGACCDMAKIQAAAKSFDLRVIDDCAHAFGGKYVGPGYTKNLGTLADLSCFSFYPNKNITAGEGGMLTTKRGDWAERARAISFQGLDSGSWKRYGADHPKDYQVLHEGIKGNLSDLHAAIGLTQLRRWPEMKLRRQAVWAIYEQTFGPKEECHSQNIYTIRVKNRDEFRRKMHEEGIGTGVHYRPLHLEPGFKFLGYKEGDFPMAEKIGKETVSLPVSSTMTEDEARRVADAASRYMEVL
jgi:dTDP-4-amino-4,6-dideoxygalactose transaminase